MTIFAFRRLSASIFLILVSTLAACTPGPVTPSAQSLKPAPADRLTIQRFRTQLAQADEPPATSLQTVALPTGTPAYELSLASSPTNTGIQMPAQGSFQLQVEASTDNSFAILDADATDGLAHIQVPAEVFDLYVRPEQYIPPSLCHGTGNSDPVLDQAEQVVLDKANQLIAAGQGACVYLPPANQRQNANCNSSKSSLQCSGPVNQTLSKSQCPEMAVLAGAVNLNHDLSDSKLFVAASNNLTLNHSAQGVFVSRGNLNTNLNGNRHLDGVFVSGGTSNLGLGGTPRFKGLYHLSNNAALSLNLNGNAQFEGQLCSTGPVNFNRNGNTQAIYNPDVVLPWLQDLPNVSALMCDARPNFYTQTQPLNCPPLPPAASLQLTDALYGIDQTLPTPTDNSWYHLPRRALPIPQDWSAPDGQSYTLTFDNQGNTALKLRWFASTEAVQVPASVKVIPRVDCIEAHSDGTHTAHLSYVNLMSGPVSLPLGGSNQVLPASLPQTQPTEFAPGQSAVYPNGLAAIPFASPSFSWQLGARLVTVQANDPNLQCPEPTVSRPELLISDVTLDDENNQSIVGTAATAAIVPDYAGKAIGLTLTGSFKDAEGDALTMSEFLFTLAPPLVQQTFIGTEPEARVLLDDSILLEVVSVSATEIKAVLQSEKLPDLYLKGLHRLSVEQGDWYTDTLIQVGEPVAPESSLAPSILSAEVIRENDGSARFVKLTGANFMLYPKFSYATIDGLFGFGFQTEVLADGTSETLVHIPDPGAFDQQNEHQIIYATPYGVVLTAF